jgi:hypothetical protein
VARAGGREAVGAGGFRGYDSKKITLSKETLLKLDDLQGFIVIGGSGSNCGNVTCVQECGRSGLETC